MIIWLQAVGRNTALPPGRVFLLMLLWFLLRLLFMCHTLRRRFETWKMKILCRLCLRFTLSLFFGSSALRRSRGQTKSRTTAINLNHVELEEDSFRSKVELVVYLERKATNDLSWDGKRLARCCWRLTARRPSSPTACRSIHPRRHRRCSHSDERRSCCWLSIRWRTWALGRGCRSFWGIQVADCHRWGRSQRVRSESRCQWLSSWCESPQRSQHLCGPSDHERLWGRRVDQLDPDRWLCWFVRSERLCLRCRRCELENEFEVYEFHLLRSTHLRGWIRPLWASRTSDRRCRAGNR